MAELRIRESRYNKSFLVGPDIFMVNIDNFSFDIYGHDNYFKNRYQQLGIKGVDVQTFKAIINRSMITHPAILQYLDSHFQLAGCFCCYLTEDDNVAKEFERLALKIYNEYDLEEYLQSHRFKEDLITATGELPPKLESEIKVQLGKYLGIHPELKDIIKPLNSQKGITTAYSTYSENLIPWTPSLVFYKTSQSMHFINYLKRGLYIECRDIPLQLRHRHPYKKVKIVPKIKLRTKHEFNQFWKGFQIILDAYLKHPHQW